MSSRRRASVAAAETRPSKPRHPDRRYDPLTTKMGDCTPHMARREFPAISGFPNDGGG
jgi:hypothetical protein